MSPERHREVSARGGQTAHAAGVAHVFDAEEAKAAGRLGGRAAAAKAAARKVGATP
jgi:general stress protein YciG